MSERLERLGELGRFEESDGTMVGYAAVIVNVTVTVTVTGIESGIGSGAAEAPSVTVAQFRMHYEADWVGTARVSEAVGITVIRLVAPVEITSTKNSVIEPVLQMVQGQVSSFDAVLRVRREGLRLGQIALLPVGAQMQMQTQMTQTQT